MFRFGYKPFIIRNMRSIYLFTKGTRHKRSHSIFFQFSMMKPSIVLLLIILSLISCKKDYQSFSVEFTGFEATGAHKTIVKVQQGFTALETDFEFGNRSMSFSVEEGEKLTIYFTFKGAGRATVKYKGVEKGNVESTSNGTTDLTVQFTAD